MTPQVHPTPLRPAERDVLGLASATLPELVDALAAAIDAVGDPAATPTATPRRWQVAVLILDEAIRLIRFGAREDLAVGGLAIAKLMASTRGGTLRTVDATAHELAQAASISLDAASEASSKGGELAVLRSWNGNALGLLRHVPREPGAHVQRADLVRLTDLSESYVSHVLADLEAAGLVIRIRDGRTVEVHLGPAAREQRVVELLDRDLVPQPDRDSATEARSRPRVAALADLDQARRRRRLRYGDAGGATTRPILEIAGAALTVDADAG